MSIEVVAGALFVAAAIPLLIFSVAAPGRRWLFSRSHGALGDMTDVRQLVLTKSPWERLGYPIAQSLGAWLARISPRGWMDKFDRQVVLAGLSGRVTAEQVLLAKVALSAGLLLFGWLVIAPLIPMGVLLALALAAIGFVAPDLWLSRRADERQHRIQIELPDVLDQITMSVDAGLGFEAALARAARVGDGPLSDELGRAVREMQIGMSRAEALRSLADRNDVADLKSLMVTIVQSEEYGLPITKVLAIQADELRDRRAQRAEERALKIPVLLILPLAVCIFPTIFIIMLGPALIRVFRDLTIVAP